MVTWACSLLAQAGECSQILVSFYGSTSLLSWANQCYDYVIPLSGFTGI